MFQNTNNRCTIIPNLIMPSYPVNQYKQLIINIKTPRLLFYLLNPPINYKTNILIKMPGPVDSLNCNMEKALGTADGNSSKLNDKAGSGNKQHRKRKRKHFNAIREQMEFYFGDANLSKDRFLKQLIDKDPFVPLDVFLTFNKLKALTTTVSEIVKSLSNSEFLELDETQQKVRRKTALPVERDVDDKTLYVESLPPNVDHDWVKQIFVRFGNVTYVSLPKYAKSRKIKEFGFIEFEKQESVAKAVKAFQEFNGVLNMQQTDPAELKSVKAFIKEQSHDENENNSTNSESNTKNAKKRKNISEKLTEGPKAKKIKPTDDNTASSDESSVSNSKNEEMTATETETDVDATDESTKKKRRRKKKKSKKLSKRKQTVEQNNDATFYDLKILPKRDWKRLRNKYLNLQREKVAEIKRKAWKEAQQQNNRENITDGIESIVTGQQSSIKKCKPSERKLHKMNMNFYGAGDTDVADNSSKVGCSDKNLKNSPALQRAPLFNYESGLIVEVGFQEPCVTIKEFKADMRQYESVKYVDVREGDMHAYLRLESADAANGFVRKINCAEYKCKVIFGDAEKEYWKKIESDREMKLNKKIKVPQKRGREKVNKLLKKHIRFGDDGPVDSSLGIDVKKINTH